MGPRATGQHTVGMHCTLQGEDRRGRPRFHDDHVKSRGSSAQADGGRSVHSWAIRHHQCVSLNSYTEPMRACVQRIDRLQACGCNTESCVHVLGVRTYVSVMYGVLSSASTL
jgi:hypothetical protein